MSEMKRIIVCTDLSSSADWVETRALMLAGELGEITLDLLHVVPAFDRNLLPDVIVRTLQETEQRLIDSCRSQLNKTAARLSEKYAIPVATTVRVGPIHREIARHAESEHADLAVLGAHSGSLVRKMFLGSTAEKALRRLTCPVLIVKREPQTPYRQILVAVDFSQPSRRAMEFCMRIAPNAQYSALHAFEVPYEAKLRFDGVSDETIVAYRASVQAEKNEAMKQFVPASAVEAGSLRHLVEFGPAADIIQQKAEALKSDLIVIGKHGQSGWEELVVGSVTKQVVLNADCDVLVIGEKSGRET